MRGWRVMTGALACALLAGCGDSGGGDSGGAPKRSSIRIAIRAVPNADTAVDIGVDLRGRSTGGDPKVVDLEADPYPFDRFHRIATLPTTPPESPTRPATSRA